MDNNANSNENANENVEITNSQEANQGTQENDNSINTIQNVASVVDYQKKFSESSSEALRLYEENKKLKEALELKDTRENYVQSKTTDNLYPGFENLDEEAKSNLLAYTNAVTSKATEQLKKDPAYAFALKQYNEQYFNGALQKTLEKYPELAESKDDFKSKYFNVNNVPENIESILGDVAKIYLFDKAKSIGAKEQEEKSKLIETERVTAGQKDPTVNRSLEDWTRMSKENPAKFAQLSKEFNEALTSGKI